jgi:hypothetical protein
MKLGRDVLASAGVGVSLYSICLLTLVAWIRSPGLYPANLVEAFAFSILILRVILALSVKRMRDLSASALVVVFGVDVLVFLVLTVGAALLGAPALGSLSADYMGAWIGASILVDPLVANFYSMRAFARRVKPSSLVPGVAGYMILLSLVPGILGATAVSGGLPGVAELLALGLKGAAGVIVESPVVLIAWASAFVSLGAYAVSFGIEPTENPVRPLLLLVIGVICAAVWGLSAIPDSIFLLGAPSLLVSGVIWWVAREQ